MWLKKNLFVTKHKWQYIYWKTDPCIYLWSPSVDLCNSRQCTTFKEYTTAYERKCYIKNQVLVWLFLPLPKSSFSLFTFMWTRSFDNNKSELLRFLWAPEIPKNQTDPSQQNWIYHMLTRLINQKLHVKSSFFLLKKIRTLDYIRINFSAKEGQVYKIKNGQSAHHRFGKLNISYLIFKKNN